MRLAEMTQHDAGKELPVCFSPGYDGLGSVRLSNLLLVVGIGSTAGVGAGVVGHHLLPESPVVQGLFIGQQRVPHRTSAASWLAARREAASSRIVRFRLVWDGRDEHTKGVQDRFFETTLGQVGVEIDLRATLEQAGTVGHQGTLYKRLREAWRARRGEIHVPLVWSVNEAKARAYLEQVAPLVARAPVDARLDLAAKAKIFEKPGRVLDIPATVQAIAGATHRDEETIDLAVRSVPPRVTWSDLTRVEVEKVVSAFETTFSLFGTGAGRAVNIKRAASKLDGTVLMRGSVFSFNEQVGPRTVENGFTLAPEIQGDEMRPGIGGGTCQVASTLHAAALFGALRIVDRQAHSRPSSYMRMGLDATVSFPVVDLKIENNLPFPAMIHAYLPNPTTIRVEILGGDPVAKVKYAYGIGDTEDFVRRITVKSFLEPGRRIRRQKGSRGYDVTSFVQVLYKDGRIEKRHYFSGYRPAPEVFWVAPGYDEADLPPLPEHAKGVEGRLVDAREDRGADVYPM